jgi:predicted nucleic acid-binding protein
MSFLVDTDVLSEPTKLQPSAKAESWLDANQALLYTSAITLGELTRGIELLPAGARRVRMERWLEDVRRTMSGRILAFNSRVSVTWGKLMAQLDREGHRMPLADSLIAAIARRHQLTVATRNTPDFARAGIRVVNPFL